MPCNINTHITKASDTLHHAQYALRKHTYDPIFEEIKTNGSYPNRFVDLWMELGN